jgi:SAM-dependent methyltransferase
MLRKLADHREERSLARLLRKKRFAFFQSLLSRLERPVYILDVGGTEAYWQAMGGWEDGVFVTLLNLTREEVTLPGVTGMTGDAREIRADDRSFDIVFSNSVIEHVGNHQDQLQMAREVRRVGKRYFIQTPNRYFPLEPHFLFPFFQFLPLGVRVWLMQNFNLGWFAKTPDRQRAREIVEGIRLLGKEEFRSLFPDARIYEEKVFGITKSFVAYGGWNEEHANPKQAFRQEV